VRPLYEESGSAAKALPSVAFAAAPSGTSASNRITQELRNRLIFLTAGGAGEPQNPEYSVQLNVTSGATEVLGDKASNIMKTGNLTMSASYSLSRMSDGTIIKVGKRQVSVFVYYPLQEFAKIRALRDAEDRAAGELAELIRADLAAVLGR
jgi:LPS-assembly lipoprotein